MIQWVYDTDYDTDFINLAEVPHLVSEPDHDRISQFAYSS